MYDFVPSAYQPVVKQGVAVILITLVAGGAYWLTRRALRLAREKGKMPEPVEIVSLFFARYTLLTVWLVLVLQRLGVLANAWGVLSAVLALVAIGFFAVWSVLSNLLCTVVLLLMRPFRVGDTVEIHPENLRGKVIDLNFTFTTLRDEQGDLLRIPNNQFLQKVIRVQHGEERMDLADQLVKDTPTE
jgi:small-conductance mechanosensitive channel